MDSSLDLVDGTWKLVICVPWIGVIARSDLLAAWICTIDVATSWPRL